MKKILIYTLVAVGILGIAGVSLASGPLFGKEGKLERFSEMLGLSTQEIQTELDSGKNFREIAEEQGITDLREQMQTQKEAYIQQLVDEGKITQEQMTQKMETKGKMNLMRIPPKEREAHLQQLVDESKITQEQMTQKKAWLGVCPCQN